MSLFDLAFPPSLERHRAALRALQESPGEPVHARHCPGELTIDWDQFDDTARLDELLARVLHPAEDEYFDSGWVDTRDWIDQARAGHDGTDFDWLMAQLADRRLQPFWNQLYDAAEIPLT